MADFDRGVKASLVTAVIYLGIAVILSAIYQNSPSSVPHLIIGTGLTPLFLLRELGDPSFVFPLLWLYMIRGLIFGAVFAALDRFLPGGASVKKGVVLSAFLWIVGMVWLICVTPGWPDDGAVTLIAVGLTVSLSSVSVALVSVVSALVFGALTGFLWNRFRGKELREERKGRSVLRVSFILGVVYWAFLAVLCLIDVVASGEIPTLAPDPWWGALLVMLVVFLGLPGWILARAAWKKTKVDKSGFKLGVAGGVMMVVTGIMLLPGLLAIIGGVLSVGRAASESSTAEVLVRDRIAKPRELRRRTNINRNIILLITSTTVLFIIIVCTTLAMPIPIEIRTWYDLNATRDNLGGSYLLMNDLDSSTPGYEELASETANQGSGWQPIGAFNTQQSNADHGFLGFEGAFDGQGYEIRDLFINRADENVIGLFWGVGYEGVIKGIGVVNATVTGNAFVGPLVGSNHGAVRDSYFTGSVTGNYFVGGLVGLSLGTLSNSNSTGSVTGNYTVGGLVGQNSGTVNNCCCAGNVAGNYSVGGLVGCSLDAVSNSYSSADVTGATIVGGLVGNCAGTVSQSYSTGSVVGNSSVGGLVGDISEGTVSNSYSTGSVTGNFSVGGLVGKNARTAVSNSFWDTEISGQATSEGGTGKTTAEMKNIATFSGAVWDIIGVANAGMRNPSYTWNIVNGVTYPFLSWQS